MTEGNFNIIAEKVDEVFMRLLSEEVATGVYTIFGTSVLDEMDTSPTVGASGSISVGPNRGRKLRSVSGRTERSLMGAQGISGNESIRSKPSRNGFGVQYEFGTSVPYLPQHEFGAIQFVRTHTRRITQAFGKPIRPTEVRVENHFRAVPARPFFTPGTQKAPARITPFLQGQINAVLAA